MRNTDLRVVVEQPRPGNLLLIPTTQRIPPLLRRVPAALALDDPLHLHLREDVKKIIIGDPSGLHVLLGVRVDDLVAKRAEAEVWSLGDEDELVCRWLANGTAVNWPQATEYAEE